MNTVSSTIDQWTRADRETVRFEESRPFSAGEADELPTEITETAITELKRNPLLIAPDHVIHDAVAVDEQPTVQVDRSAVVPALPPADEPSRPDVSTVLGVLRRRAGLPGERPVDAPNRDGVTPTGTPRRVLISKPRQVSVERPLPPTAYTHPVGFEAPVAAFEEPLLPTDPLTIEEPVALQTLYRELTFAEEYGWWVVGATVGSAFGIFLSTAAFALAVSW